MNQLAICLETEAVSDPVYVMSCTSVNNVSWNEELETITSVWGVQVKFSNGQIVAMPDLCTDRGDIQILANRLSGASLSPGFLQYIFEDFLGEIYG